ncbi:putative ribonuclease H-like domain-containing protein [Tanacetum coccineum]
MGNKMEYWIQNADHILEYCSAMEQSKEAGLVGMKNREDEGRLILNSSLQKSLVTASQTMKKNNLKFLRFEKKAKDERRHYTISSHCVGGEWGGVGVVGQIMMAAENKTDEVARSDPSCASRNRPQSHLLIDTSCMVIQCTDKNIDQGGIVKSVEVEMVEIRKRQPFRTSSLTFENVYYVKRCSTLTLLSEEFQLPDASQVVLRIPRKHDLYTFHISDLQPEQKVTCLVAKASLDESTRWHRRMVIVILQNNQRVAKEGLVVGLPLKDIWFSTSNTAENTIQAEQKIRNQGVSAVTDPAGIDSAVREPAGIVSADGVSTGSPSADSEYLLYSKPTSMKAKALDDPDWCCIANQEEMQQFINHQVLETCPSPSRQTYNRDKMDLKNKRDARGLVVMNKARLVAQGHRQEEALITRGWTVVKALYGLIKHLDLLMKGEFEMSAMGEMTFFLGLQVKQLPDGLFISQDKYVKDMLTKFDMEFCKNLQTTPYEACSWQKADYCGYFFHLGRVCLSCSLLAAGAQSTICIVKNPVFHQRTNHIEIGITLLEMPKDNKLDSSAVDPQTADNVDMCIVGYYFSVICILPADEWFLLVGLWYLLLVIFPACNTPWCLSFPAGCTMVLCMVVTFCLGGVGDDWLLQVLNYFSLVLSILLERFGFAVVLSSAEVIVPAWISCSCCPTWVPADRYLNPDGGRTM